MTNRKDGSSPEDPAVCAGDDTMLRVLSAAFERSPSAVVITDPSGRIEYVNPQFAEMTGYDRTELTGADTSILGERSSLDRGRMWAKLLAGEPWEDRFWSKRKNGEIYWVSAHISPIRDANGVVTHVLGINEDITQRSWEDEAREQAEEPALPVADTKPFFVLGVYFILVVALDGTILFTTGTVPGMTRDEAVGSKIYRYTPPEHIEMLRTKMEKVAQSGVGVSYELASVGPHGTTAIYVTRIGPIRREGQVVALSLISSDITEHKRLEAALRASEARFRSLSEAAIEGVAIHDNGVLLDANRALAAMFGYEDSEVIGMHALELTAPEYRELVLENIRTGYEGVYEALGLRKDGSTFPIDICGKNIVHQGRRVRVTAIRDITERKRSKAVSSEAGSARENDNLPDLSHRELEVLELLAQGLTNRAAAERLGLSPRTIDHHVSHILDKLHVPNRTAAVVAAKHTGLLLAESADR